jgi:hypothetical protein
MFVLSAFSMHSNPDKLSQGESIGFPFVFYTTASADGPSSVSIIGLLGNVFVFFSIAYAFAFVLHKLQGVGANRKLRTYP